MKNIQKLLSRSLLVLALSSCVPVLHVHHPKPGKAAVKAPPGQVKKATGSQSAKPYAPGQQKKKKN